MPANTPPGKRLPSGKPPKVDPHAERLRRPLSLPIRRPDSRRGGKR
jgi:hypothetical protein